MKKKSLYKINNFPFQGILSKKKSLEKIGRSTSNTEVGSFDLVVRTTKNYHFLTSSLSGRGGGKLKILVQIIFSFCMNLSIQKIFKNLLMTF